MLVARPLDASSSRSETPQFIPPVALHRKYWLVGSCKSRKRPKMCLKDIYELLATSAWLRWHALMEMQTTTTSIIPKSRGALSSFSRLLFSLLHVEQHFCTGRAPTHFLKAVAKPARRRRRTDLQSLTCRARASVRLRGHTIIPITAISLLRPFERHSGI